MVPSDLVPGVDEVLEGLDIWKVGNVSAPRIPWSGIMNEQSRKEPYIGVPTNEEKSARMHMPIAGKKARDSKRCLEPQPSLNPDF